MVEESKEDSSDVKNYEFVALKKLDSIARKGIDFSSLREIKILKELKEHTNIIKVIAIGREWLNSV